MKTNYILLASQRGFEALYYETKHELLYRIPAQTRDDEGKLPPKYLQVVICLFIMMILIIAAEKKDIATILALEGIWAAVLYVERITWNMKMQKRLLDQKPVELSRLTHEEREELLLSVKLGTFSLYPRNGYAFPPMSALSTIVLAFQIAFMFPDSGIYHYVLRYSSPDKTVPLLFLTILMYEFDWYNNSFTSQKRRRRIYQKLKIDAETIEKQRAETKREETEPEKTELEPDYGLDLSYLDVDVIINEYIDES